MILVLKIKINTFYYYFDIFIFTGNCSDQLYFSPSYDEESSMDQTLFQPFSTTSSGITSQMSFCNEDSLKLPAAEFFESTINKCIINECLDILNSIQDNSDTHDQNDTITTMHESNESIENECKILNMIQIPMLNSQNIKFNLVSPTLISSYLSIHYLWESSSRLLFLSIYWFKKIQAFKLLSEDIQIELLQSSWAELFVIGLVQCSKSLSIDTILSSMISHLKTSIIHDKLSSSKIVKKTRHVIKIKQFLEAINVLEVDEFEFAYLRLLCLFNYDNLTPKPCLNERKKGIVEQIQNCAFTGLKYHVQNQSEKSPSLNGDMKYSKILIKLSGLRALDPQIIEDIFFPNLMGKIKIDVVVPYILKLCNGIKNETF